MLPGYPIILLKSNKFNMAAESVTRSVIGIRINQLVGYWAHGHLVALVDYLVFVY